MRIQGLQKLTLLDYPENVACTVFFAGCNFRCPFCHNASLVTHIPSEAEMTEEAFFSFLKKRQGVLDGVCITGGEPLLQKGIEDFIRKIKELGYSVKLDTNGSFPNKLKYLVQEKLVDYVAMDIKNSPERYDLTIGKNKILVDGAYDVIGQSTSTKHDYLDEIQESVAFLKEGHVPYEFRTTVVKNYHNIEAFEKIGQWLVGTEKYFLQAFVDSGDLIEANLEGCDEKEMKEFLSAVKNYIPNAKLRGI